MGHLMSMSDDKLDVIFELREKFMTHMREIHPDVYPQWPVDLTNKQSQQVIRDIALKGVEEMFEALGHLKNWKPHRTIQDKNFDKEEFLEEIVDAFNYFLSLLVMTGTTSDELFRAYVKKDAIIHARLDDGY